MFKQRINLSESFREICDGGFRLFKVSRLLAECFLGMLERLYRGMCLSCRSGVWRMSAAVFRKAYVFRRI